MYPCNEYMLISGMLVMRDYCNPKLISWQFLNVRGGDATFWN